MTFPLVAAALTLSQFAPTFAKWIGGETGEIVAKGVVEAAEKITGCTDIESMLRSLEESDQERRAFQKALADLEKELEVTLIQDRQNARSRDSELQRVFHRNKRADIMVICASVGLVLCLVCLGVWGDQLNGETVGIISTISGIFGACLKDAYAFEFGSSRGSKEKDATMSYMLGKMEP